MPYVLGKVKRTVDGQPIGDIEDLDGANITGFVKNDDGTFTITGKNSSDEDISVTLDLREVRPSDELTASGLADADRHFVLDVSTDPISLKFIQTQNLKTVFGGTAELISAPFDLTALSKVTKTLSEDITNFKNIMIIGGDGTTFGRGLGSTMVPRSEIPTSDGSVDQYLYGISGGSSARLYRINQSNGAIAVDIGSMGSRYGGLAEVNGAVYAYNINSGLYSVDLETGSASRIGGSTYSGDDVVALGSVNDVLYLVHTEESGANNSDLYSLNVATGARTLVRDNFLSSNNKIISLGGLGEVLYGRSDGNRLYSNLQPGGSITNVGGLGVSLYVGDGWCRKHALRESYNYWRLGDLLHRREHGGCNIS